MKRGGEKTGGEGQGKGEGWERGEGSRKGRKREGQGKREVGGKREEYLPKSDWYIMFTTLVYTYLQKAPM